MLLALIRGLVFAQPNDMDNIAAISRLIVSYTKHMDLGYTPFNESQHNVRDP